MSNFRDATRPLPVFITGPPYTLPVPPRKSIQIPTDYAPGFGRGWGPYGINGPDGAEYGPTKHDDLKTWTPNPRKMSAGWSESDYSPEDWVLVSEALTKQTNKRLAEYRQQLIDLTNSAEEHFPSQLSAERHTQQKDSSPAPQSSDVAPSSSFPKLKLKVRMPPKLTIKINPKAVTDRINGKVVINEISDNAVAEKINDKVATDQMNDKVVTDQINDKAVTDKINDKAVITKITTKAAASTKLWNCTYLDCIHDEMTSNPIKETGRKFISDFFGRNKTETKTIPVEVWAWVCRKDYQTKKYNAEQTDDGYVTFWLRHFRTQLVRLQLWRPDATFKVQLLAGAEGRLNKYHTMLVQNGGDVVAAQKAVAVVPKKDMKGKPLPLSNVDAIDPVQAQYIKTTFAGLRSFDYIFDTILPWIEQSLKSGALSRMPPIECLIQPVEAGDVVNSPTENYQMWFNTQTPVTSPSCDGPFTPITSKWTARDHEAAVALMALAGAITPRGPRQRYNGVPYEGKGKKRMADSPDNEPAQKRRTRSSA